MYYGGITFLKYVLIIRVTQLPTLLLVKTPIPRPHCYTPQLPLYYNPLRVDSEVCWTVRSTAWRALPPLNEERHRRAHLSCYRDADSKEAVCIACCAELSSHKSSGHRELCLHGGRGQLSS